MVFTRSGPMLRAAPYQELMAINAAKVYERSRNRALYFQDGRWKTDGPVRQSVERDGYDPLRGWELTKDRTVHFHIKDWVHGEQHGRVAGEGRGHIAEIMADAVKRGYDGFAVMEPHLLGGGPTGGHTGPELFPKAVTAFKRILDQVGGKYR